jgi:peptidoglycan hydrolase CwlO-like protein
LAVRLGVGPIWYILHIANSVDIRYIAEGVVAYQAARRHARALSAYSNRNDPGARSAAPLAAQATLHNETLDSCVHALVDLSPVSLIQLPSATKPSALDARVAALEDQMKSLLATVKPLEIQLGAVDGKLSRVESTVKSCQAKVTSTITRVDESHKALESRIASLSTRDAANPPPDILTAVGRENGKLAERLKSLEATMRETADKSAKLEARIVEVENLRPKIDDHATKLVITEGKISEIRVSSSFLRTANWD